MSFDIEKVGAKKTSAKQGYSMEKMQQTASAAFNYATNSIGALLNGSMQAPSGAHSVNTSAASF